MQAKSFRGTLVEDIQSALHETISDGFNSILAGATGGNVEMHNLTNCCVVLKEK